MIYDRVSGAILGMAVGCALGLPGANESRSKILEMFGKGGITDFSPSPSLPPGSPGPGCSLSLKVLELLTSHGNLDIDSLEEKLKEVCTPWKAEEKGKSYELLLGIPIGLYFYKENDPLARASVRVGAMVGQSEASMASVLALAYSISLSVKNYTLYEIVEGGVSMFYEIHNPPKGPLGTVFDLMDKDIDEAESIFGPSQDQETVLARSFYAFLKFNESFEDAVLASVNMSGPSDIQGGITGALMGSHRGSKAIPQKWSERVSQREALNSLSKSLYRVLLKKQVEF